MQTKLATVFLAACISLSAHAYSGEELYGDCQAADDVYAGKTSADPYQSIRSARCMSYISGFADGYAVGDYLAEKVGVSLNAICLPRDQNLPYRMVRSVLSHLDHLPPKPASSTAMLVAAALAKTFPCADQLEPKK
jgi:hypothetical protein